MIEYDKFKKSLKHLELQHIQTLSGETWAWRHLWI
jgi:hypothetical protein